ncbi:MAG: enoyl-CoA hydratase-related protein [Natronosporangium sp.]
MSDPLLVTRDGAVATLTLNRPDSLNSLDVALKEALAEQLVAVADDHGVRAVVLTGAGRAFCVGQDLREHVAQLESGSGPPLDTVLVHYAPIVQALAGLPKPVVAAVNGMAAGAGAGLAFLADFRVGGPGTGFLTAFANVGLAADTGMSWTLPRLVGHAKATELLMLVERVPAPEAHRLGLLTTLVSSDEEVLPTAHSLAARLADGPTVAYAQLKRELAAAGGTLAESLAVEADAQAVCGATADHRAATAAFVAEQQPTFTGR